MIDPMVLETLKQIVVTLQGLMIEVKARRRHASTSDTDVLYALRDLIKLTRKLIEKEELP